MKKIAVFMSVIMMLSVNMFGCGKDETPESPVEPDISIELSVSKLDIKVGQSIKVIAQCSNPKAVLVWRSQNVQIADVYSDGTVLGRKKGTTQIVCSDKNGKASAILTVNVYQPVSGVVLDKTVDSCELGGTIQLTATVYPTNADNKNIVWASSNIAVATVNQNGVVHGISEGTSVIRVITEEGDKMDELEITVSEAITVAYICNNTLRDYLVADTATRASMRTTYKTQQWDKGKYYDYQALNIAWVGDGSSSYHVYIADNQEYNKAYEAVTNGTVLNSGICVPGNTYYVKVEGDNGMVKQTKINIADQPVRIVNVDGVANVRDLGGYRTASGKYVAYGKIYRGAQLEMKDGLPSYKQSAATDYGKTVLKDFLGIKTELDFRMDSEIPSDGKNSVGFENYYQKPNVYPYSWLIPQNNADGLYNATYRSSSAAELKFVFECFADETKYPIYFHCVQGADRTGTVAFLLNALLGVEYEDLVRDFELTSFSAMGARGCVVDSSNLNKSTNPWLYSLDEVRNSSALYQFYWQLMHYYGEAESTDVSVAAENYLTTVCKVSKANIEKIKEIMLVNK